MNRLITFEILLHEYVWLLQQPHYQEKKSDVSFRPNTSSIEAIVSLCWRTFAVLRKYDVSATKFVLFSKPVLQLWYTFVRLANRLIFKVCFNMASTAVLL